MENQNMIRNNAVFQGTITEAPYAIFIQKEKYYSRFYIKSERQSGINDEVPVYIQGSNEALVPGTKVSVRGEVRTYNTKKGKLLVYIFAEEVTVIHEENITKDKNEIEFKAIICKVNPVRVTPAGYRVTDFMIVVQDEDNYFSYIPCIAWGVTAFRVSKMEPGDKVAALGRFQSRNYLKKLENCESEVRTTYEISISGLQKIELIEE